MEFLILGTFIFFGIHLLPLLAIKKSLIDKFGKKPYMAIFAIISALGLGLMIYGKGHADFIPVWQPMTLAYWVPILVMWPTMVLFVWAEIPCSMKITLRHPMLIGIVLFTTSHLIANGDLASIILFGSFAIYSLFVIFRQGFQKKESNIPASTPKWNAFGLILGTLLYGAIFHFHQNITGMPIQV
jgi:uncharacterized membrane protein